MRILDVLSFMGCVVLTFSTSAIGQNATPAPLTYTPLATPCRAVDTRTTGTPIQGGTTREFTPFSGGCNISVPADGTIVYVVNVTVVPHGGLGFLTVWPAGEEQPTVSLLNSYDGRTKANAALVTGGTGGNISVFASNTTDFILDVTGYFSENPNGMVYVAVPPCRIIDTRNGLGTLADGRSGSTLVANQAETWDIAYTVTIDDTPPAANHCNLPYSVGSAYSVNVTVVPINNAPVWFTSVWGSTAPPLAPNTEPAFSNVNVYTDTDTANAAIINGPLTLTAFADVATDLVVDVTGWFAPVNVASEGLSLYALPPCRALDTRESSTDGLQGILQVPLAGPASLNCQIPTGLPSPRAFVLNATIVPTSSVGYLTLWPDGQTEPVVSTLNANDAYVTSNMAIVGTGPLSSNPAVQAIQAQASTATKMDLILDESGFFALNPATEQPKVVFIGDETTSSWPMANQPNWINRGVPGNTTAQMLARFQTDVIDLHPDVVHIMGGGNDVLNETWSNGSQCGPDACENIAMMVQLAEDAGIRTVVGSPLYVGNMTEDQEIELSTMNRFLREEFTTPNQPAGSLQAGFVDYYEGGSGAATMTAMAEAEIGLVYGTPLP